MRNSRTFEITTISILVALTVVFASIPQLGYIYVGPVALTTMHIPVLIGGVVGGRKAAYSLALVFGLSSMLNAMFNPLLLNAYFQNPLVSVLPRVLWGFAFYEIYLLMRRWIKNRYVSVITHMVVSTFVHTALVATALVLFTQDQLIDDGIATSVGGLMFGLFLVNMVFEIIAAGLIAAPIGQRLLDYKESQDLV